MTQFLCSDCRKKIRLNQKICKNCWSELVWGNWNREKEQEEISYFTCPDCNQPIKLNQKSCNNCWAELVWKNWNQDSYINMNNWFNKKKIINILFFTILVIIIIKLTRHNIDEDTSEVIIWIITISIVIYILYLLIRKLILKNDPKLNNALINACKEGDIIEVKNLIERWANVNYQKYNVNPLDTNPLACAISKWNYQIVEILLKNWANPNKIVEWTWMSILWLAKMYMIGQSAWSELVNLVKKATWKDIKNPIQQQDIIVNLLRRYWAK